MASVVPITLQGKTLGQRHCLLNSLVSNAFTANDSFEAVINAAESSPVDRLFKIDLASKHRHVEYILKTLQDDDMLYVSRALKCKWLLDEAYRDIFNPDNLEKSLYPHMITTAVNKTKHWINLNLQDPLRCQQFYEYYCETDAHMAIKFLLKCPKETIEDEFPKWLDKITPEQFKVLCERSAAVAKIFFDTLDKKKSLKEKYFNNVQKYYDGLKQILKADTGLFLNIVENIKWKFPHLSSSATKFVMKQAKSAFLQKPELYAVNIMHMESLAQCLSAEECEELVLKLARAKFLEQHFKGWFSYKNVEPLIKRLDVSKQTEFKKRVFVDKDFGKEVNEWPYPESTYFDESHWDSDSDSSDDPSDVFEDYEESFNYEDIIPYRYIKHKKKSNRRKGRNRKIPKAETLLDMLFEEYRFMSFDETLLELRKKISAESSHKNRMLMLLVLVSKSGGTTENLKQLFRLLLMHRNEPAQVRAAVVRSLVKRACIWRANEDIWKSLLVFADGLGLDGKDSTSDCKEGLHAVVIRNLLSGCEWDTAIMSVFLQSFSTMTQYPITSTEKEILGSNLLKLLLMSEKDVADVYIKSEILIQILHTFQAYHLKVNSEFIANVQALAAKDMHAARGVLHELFRSRIARKELFYENFDLWRMSHTYSVDAWVISYADTLGSLRTSNICINALKHDADILVTAGDVFVQMVLSERSIRADNFLRKINIYFGEKQGLRDHFVIAMMEAKTNKKLARPIVHLMGENLKSYILKLDASDTKEVKLFAAQIRARAHLARPALKLDSLEWSSLGAKHIANRVLTCRQREVEHFIKQLLTWKQTAKLAIIVARRVNLEADTIAAVADIRPPVALKTALASIRRDGDKYDTRIWEVVKRLMATCNTKRVKEMHYIKRYLQEIEKIPLMIRPEFVTSVYTVLKENDPETASSLLYQVNLHLPKISEAFVEKVLMDYFNSEFVLEWMSNSDRTYVSKASLHLRILGKYLLLGKSKESQSRRFENFGILYLNRLRSYWNAAEKNKKFLGYLNDLLKALKYTDVFLDDEYYTCLPVMEKMVNWMEEVLPMEKYFKLFVDLHLTMCYFKAIRQSLKQRPDAFTDKKTRREQGVKVVGEIFGTYIAREVHELRMKYFDSIIQLYGSCLIAYLSSYFNGAIRHMVLPIVKAIAANAVEIECYLPLALLDTYGFEGKYVDELYESIKNRNDTAIQFLDYLFAARE